VQAELETIRLDKWLWTARFFKTRKLAAEAISDGRLKRRFYSMKKQLKVLQNANNKLFNSVNNANYLISAVRILNPTKRKDG